MPAGVRCLLRLPRPSTAPRSVLLRVFQGPQSFAVCWEGLLPDHLSLLVDLYVTTFVALWGSAPMSTSTLVASSFVFGPSPWRAEDNPTLGEIHASALSHAARRSLRWAAGLEQANPHAHKDGTDFASDP